MPRKHVVITGTGRTGTTFLVQLLTSLGLDTGFSLDNMILDEYAKAGLEHDIRDVNAPYIVKDPIFCYYADEVLRDESIVIEHVFVPVRDISAAAESRHHVTKLAIPWYRFDKRWLFRRNKLVVPGGLWITRKKHDQEDILLRQFYKLIMDLSHSNISISFIAYPRLIKDKPYLYEKLKPIIGKIDYEEFSLSFDKTVRPDWAHRFSENDV